MRFRVCRGFEQLSSSIDWGMTLNKKAKTCPDYDVTHRKPQTQNKKNSNGNKRLLKSIEDLNPLA